MRYRELARVIAAKAAGIPEASLRRYNSKPEMIDRPIGPKTLLTDEEELGLATAALWLKERGLPLDALQLKCSAKDNVGNLDEMFIRFDLKSRKVIAERNAKSVYQLSSIVGDQLEHITVVAFVTTNEHVGKKNATEHEPRRAGIIRAAGAQHATADQWIRMMEEEDALQEQKKQEAEQRAKAKEEQKPNCSVHICDMRTLSETLILPGHPGDARTSSAATINVNVSRPEEDRNNSTMSDLIDEAPPSSDEAQPPDEVSA
eukprot:Em0010g564a